MENPPHRTDRFVPESRTYSRVFSASSVPFLSSFGPPAAAQAACTTVLRAPNCSAYPIDISLSIKLALQVPDNRLQCAILSPASKPIVYCLPAAVVLGQVRHGAPERSGLENAVEYLPMVLVGTAATVDLWEHRFDAFELLTG